MSRRGNCQDNAVVESFFNLVKRERVRRRTYKLLQKLRSGPIKLLATHCDVERMSKMFPDEPELIFYPDFKDDIKELRAAEQENRGDSKKGSG